eukprot:scaffold79760_cov57-Attheya_sp.AAC.3
MQTCLEQRFIALLYETHVRIGLGGETGLDNIYTDVEFIAQTYFTDPNYLRINGRPVIYLYKSRVLHQHAAADNGGHDLYIIGDQAFGTAPRPGPGASYDPFELLDSVSVLTSYAVYGDIGRGGYAGPDDIIGYQSKQQNWQNVVLAHGDCSFIPP